MGIVNRTPDSFYDGGAYLGDRAARARVEQLVLEGADIIDVGAESSRPGAPVVSAAEQIERLGDAIPHAASLGVVVSVDTTSAEVAAHAVEQGARMINSIALTPAAELGRVAATGDVDLVLTHCRAPSNELDVHNDMPGFSRYDDDAYDDVVEDVASEWLEAAGRARAAGMDSGRIVFDPGLGFTKNARHSLELAARLEELASRVAPHRILVGSSRKSYLAAAVADQLGTDPPAPEERLGGSVAAALDSAAKGAHILRVHDVAVVRQALAYAAATAEVHTGRASHAAPRGGAPC